MLVNVVTKKIANTRGLKATLTFIAWAKSAVVRCVCAVELTCKNVSSRLSVGEGMLCCQYRDTARDGGGGWWETTACCCRS